MEDSQEMARRLALLLKQREVLRQQSELIAQAFAAIGDEIQLLRAQARAAGVVLGDDPQ